MIRVTVTDENGNELAQLRIERFRELNPGWDFNDYSVEVAVDRGRGWIALYRRHVRGHRRLKSNVLALLRAALATLGDEELELEDGIAPSDLARQERGTRLAIPPTAPDSKYHR